MIYHFKYRTHEYLPDYSAIFDGLGPRDPGSCDDNSYNNSHATSHFGRVG